MIEGMILAAGMGSRLGALTAERPKALMTIGDRTLLEIALCRMAEAGVEHVVVNVHHKAEMIERWLCEHALPCRVSISDERQTLLDTGGALKHAEPLLQGGADSLLIVHNVDVLSHVDLRVVAERHTAEHNLATLCVSQRATQRALLFDDGGLLLRRAGAEPHGNGQHAMAFSGIAVVCHELLHLLPPASHPYPIIDQYISLAAEGHRIGSFEHAAADWIDVGRPETLQKAQQWTIS